MSQRRADGNDTAQNNRKNKNSVSGSNINEDIEVCATELEQSFDRYHSEIKTDASFDVDPSSIICDRAKKIRRSPQIRVYDNCIEPDQSDHSPQRYLGKTKK